jgi:hypothetical protein
MIVSCMVLGTIASGGSEYISSVDYQSPNIALHS